MNRPNLAAVARALAEPLESRRQLAASVSGDGTLLVNGSATSDTIEIFVGNGSTYRVTVAPAGATPTNGLLEEYTFDAADVDRISVRGGAGNDGVRVAASIGLDASLLGEAGNDTIVGAAGDDYLAGDDGEDLIYGLGGDDYIITGSSKNTAYGGEGNDRVAGSSGRDFLYGDGGTDRLYGGNGDDRLDGGTGTDRLYGGGGNDELFGGSSNDRIYGEDGNDSLFGGNGNDFLNGDDGTNFSNGGNNDDSAVRKTGDRYFAVETYV